MARPPLGDGYTYKMVVGDDICGYNYIRIVPATLTIVPAYTDISATIAWKDSSNKEGLRPSAEDYAKLLSLTADGAASDMLPVVVDNGDDTYTVTYTGVRQYAYDDNGERHDVDYKITQADVSGILPITLLSATRASSRIRMRWLLLSPSRSHSRSLSLSPKRSK